jgi:5-methylcytosine-specific restriction endonuclease McrA
MSEDDGTLDLQRELAERMAQAKQALDAAQEISDRKAEAARRRILRYERWESIRRKMVKVYESHGVQLIGPDLDSELPEVDASGTFFVQAQVARGEDVEAVRIECTMEGGDRVAFPVLAPTHVPLTDAEKRERADAARREDEEALVARARAVAAERKRAEEVAWAKRVLEGTESAATERTPIPREVKLRVFERDGGACVECGSRALLQFDHIIPLARGGSNAIGNLQLLCDECNLRKGASL